MKEELSRDKVSWEVSDLLKERVEVLRWLFPLTAREEEAHD